MKCPECKKCQVEIDPEYPTMVKCPGCGVEHSLLYVEAFWDGWFAMGKVVTDAVGELRVDK